LREKPLRLKRKFHSDFNLICAVQTSRKKYSISRFSQITVLVVAIPFRQEGRIARRHERGTGCDGRESAGTPTLSQGGMNPVSDRAARRTNGVSAFAEVRLNSGCARRSYFGEDGSRTAKPCGLDTRCWCQVCGGQPTQPGPAKP
jgi:hypothetical protein